MVGFQVWLISIIFSVYLEDWDSFVMLYQGSRRIVLITKFTLLLKGHT